MSEDEPSAPSRVVVALNVLRRDLEILDLAAVLAARRQAQLLALFVEDMNLLRLAEFPFAREVGRLSATERELDNPRILRTHRSRGELIREALARLNQQLQIQVEFKTIRGQFVPVVLAETGQVDVLFLSHKLETDPRARRPAAPPVWTVYDGSEAAARALLTAIELASAEALGLCIALPARNEGEFAALRTHALCLCPGTTPPRFFPAPPTDGIHLLRQIRQTGCRILVVPRDAGELVTTLAEAAACPVVLV